MIIFILEQCGNTSSLTVASSLPLCLAVMVVRWGHRSSDGSTSLTMQSNALAQGCRVS